MVLTMWRTKNFDSEQEAMDWIESHEVQWHRVFVADRPFSIEWKPLRVIQFDDED